MPYNNMFPVGYQPSQMFYSPYQQSVMQQAQTPAMQPASMPMQQPMQAPMQPQVVQQAPVQPAPSKIWVKSDKEALEYPVFANCSVDLWNENTPHVYRKMADASGKPDTRKFQLTEVPMGVVPENAMPTPAQEPERQEIDLSAYAVKTDVAAIAGAVNNLTKDMDALKDEVANLASQAVKRAVGAKPKKEAAAEDE